MTRSPTCPLPTIERLPAAAGTRPGGKTAPSIFASGPPRGSRNREIHETFADRASHARPGPAAQRAPVSCATRSPQRGPAQTQIGNINQAETTLRQAHDVAAVQRAKIDFLPMQLRHEARQLWPVDRLAADKPVAQHLTGERAVSHHVPGCFRALKKCPHLHCRHTGLRQALRVLHKALSIRPPGCRRHAALTAKQFQDGSRRRPRHFHTEGVALEHLRRIQQALQTRARKRTRPMPVA